MTRNTKLLALITVFICAIMVYVGLKPKGFRLRNDVTWLTNSNGIKFGKMGIAFTKPFCLKDISAEDSLTVEMVLKIPKKKDGRQSTILQLFNSTDNTSFRLNKWQKYIIVEKKYNHIFFDTTIDFGKGTEQNKIHHLVITVCKAGSALYIDGAQSGFFA